ncbi:efflux RND transporter periplasmic adaptor subunit [Thalassospira lucentensis]|uniref:efflux RND transporter periplasmic adaptor subunit n=1 Tax=Thalassospira lucentensis TaxID=168935 RepID=UPI00142D3512|nr:efflux RND transporter periplasmic adaptor subunit [Thalassospira lucentensis]NIZ03918.1 efflux RND transporter periplasmic adaptor subunit [Thalassospira lucentensis]
MTRKTPLLVAGLAIIVIAALAYIFAKDDIMAIITPGEQPGAMQASGAGAGAGAERGLPVIAERATLMDEKTVVEAVGTGKSSLGVSIYPAVSGEVADVLFHAGDHVTKDQVLVILDSDRERLARDLAALQVKDAKQLLARYEKARPLGAVAESEVDTARTALAQARIELDQAEVNLADRTILAPFDGIVGISEIEAGDRVDSSTAIVTLDNIESILVDFEVAETRFENIKPGQKVRVETWSLPGELFEGTVDAIGSRIDPVSRTFSVRARVPNPNGRLLAGMSFAVYVDIEGKQYPSVPEISVLWGDDGTYVWRIDDENKVSQVPVRVVKRTNGRILLDGDISSGDLIVVEGVLRLRPGRVVDATIRGEDQAGVAARENPGEGS